MNQDLGAHGSDRRLPESSRTRWIMWPGLGGWTEGQVIRLAWNSAYDQS